MDAGEGDAAINNRKKSLSFYTLERLRDELRNAEARVNLREKPAAELRQIVRQGRSASGRPDSPLPLPLNILIHGEMAKLNAACIKGQDNDSLRTLIRKYRADGATPRRRSA